MSPYIVSLNSQFKLVRMNKKFENNKSFFATKAFLTCNCIFSGVSGSSCERTESAKYIFNTFRELKFNEAFFTQ
ncbi:hypothetical protein BpHYR1_043217 [Brachionus plicatilis]|uniref:Uncharacterized protein n=1 Tax=Brachionus plicatilis TaxID=10195 RepID=A0A3M7QPW1_BRAPC|nr:hypothetical protein BpHYR1_043217 [Brachionus plicatilis]